MVASRQCGPATVTGDLRDILVVGGGPTGLTLALQAHLHGADVTVLERRAAPGRPSRAMVVHPRTLEVLRPLGVVEELLAAGIPGPSIDLHLAGRVVHTRLGDFALADTPYPYLLLIRQSDLEAVLLHAADRLGIDIERGVEARGYRVERGTPVTTVATSAGSHEVPARFLVGCDGVASRVRTSAGIQFRGGRYPTDILLADVELTGPSEGWSDRRGHVVLTRQGLLMLLPLGERATWRLVAGVPSGSGETSADGLGPPVPEQKVVDTVRASGLPVEIASVAWSSGVPVHHRLASRYRRGSVLLAGDAAHRFSPAGGQGMNTGIQDACALGWRLALAASSPTRADLLLGSYEMERRGVARSVLALTEALFWLEAGRGPMASAVRQVAPAAAGGMLPMLLRRESLVASVVRIVSQLNWGYPHSPLSLQVRSMARPGAESAKAPDRPGRRLRDTDVLVDGRCRRLHEMTAAPGFHVLLYRDALLPSGVLPLAPCLVSVHRVQTWTGDGAVVVRPDGHIGYRGPASQLGSWFRLVDDRRHSPVRG